MSTPSSSLLTSLVQLTSDLEQQRFPESALYVVATPIGNIADVSLRAMKVLSLVDAIACEDTRNTGLLMSRLGLSTPLFSAHQHNELTARIRELMKTKHKILLPRHRHFIQIDFDQLG